MKPSFEFDDILVSEIVVPPECVRDDDAKVDDEILLKSIRQSGIQQPVIVLRDGERFRLVKGSRRLAAAAALGLPRVPAVVGDLPAGEEMGAYSRRLRFLLSEHRQDLMPSQRAALIEKLKETMHLTNKAVAAYLGVDQDSITNWLALRRYVPAVVRAMDSGAITMRSARVFDGMSETGQLRLVERHGEQLAGGGDVHKELRAQYPPEKFPAFYREPEKIAAKLAKKQGKRAGKKRVDYTADEKKRLIHSVEIRDAEIAESKEEAAELKREIAEAAPIVAAILRNRALRSLVPADILPEIERFAEIYV